MMKTIGILGGMGPLATADLFYRIIAMTQAGSDNEHIPILIDNNTRVPDRTAAILHGGESPVQELLRSVRRLESMGADFLIMPCNTAHWFYGQIAERTRLPFINMIEEAGKEIQNLGIRRVGLLATDGTLSVGIYDKVFERLGIAFITPPPQEQRHVMEMVYTGIKGGGTYDPAQFCQALLNMEQRGAEAFVLGCTELPVAFDRFRIPNKAINPTAILAARAIVLAGGKVVCKADEKDM